MKATKVLIIDDEEQDQKGMTIALEKEGYSHVTCAQTGKEGIELAKSFKPDVIITDVVLPVMDGIEVCEHIKKISGLSTKVIIITGHLEAVDADKARVCGADEIIEKMPGFNNIPQTIERLINSNSD